MDSVPITDIVVRILPSLSGHKTSTTQVRQYDVHVYSQLPLDIDCTPSRHVAEVWQKLPLRGTGQLRVPWRRYQDHLASFYEGEKGVEMMYVRMRETLSRELEVLVDQVQAAGEPWRVWWASDAPELDDMPWELLFYGNSRRAVAVQFIFARGVPPRIPSPILPLRGPLRLLWFDSPLSPSWMHELFSQVGFPGIQPVPCSGDLREGMAMAAEHGIELMHVCTDGVVSLAYEGVLYRHGDQRPEHSAHEVSERLRGSRVTVIGLTAQQYSHPDMIEVSGREVVSAYRAFACFAASRVPLPSILAPLGPAQSDVEFRFWRTFYTQLGDCYRLDRALAEARYATPSSTHALFLRHGHHKLFRTAATRFVPERPPQRLALDLRNSINATSQVHALGEKYGALPDYLQLFAKEETEHQKAIEEELDVWSRPEGDEQ